MEALQQEFWGKEGLALKGEGASVDEGTKSEPTLPTGPLETAQQVTPPLDFQEVMTCLWKDPLPAAAHEALLEPLWLEAVMEPTVAMMCASHIMKDEAMGVTYMDTITTSMG